MNRDGVEAACRRIAGEILNVAAESLRSDSRASTTPNWDSLALVRMILALEKEFHTRLSVREIEKAGTFGDIVSLFAARSNSTP